MLNGGPLVNAINASHFSCRKEKETTFSKFEIDVSSDTGTGTGSWVVRLLLLLTRNTIECVNCETFNVLKHFVVKMYSFDGDKFLRYALLLESEI